MITLRPPGSAATSQALAHPNPSPNMQATSPNITHVALPYGAPKFAESNVARFNGNSDVRPAQLAKALVGRAFTKKTALEQTRHHPNPSPTSGRGGPNHEGAMHTTHGGKPIHVQKRTPEDIRRREGIIRPPSHMHHDTIARHTGKTPRTIAPNLFGVKAGVEAAKKHMSHGAATHAPPRHAAVTSVGGKAVIAGQAKTSPRMNVEPSRSGNGPSVQHIGPAVKSMSPIAKVGAAAKPAIKPSSPLAHVGAAVKPSPMAAKPAATLAHNPTASKALGLPTFANKLGSAFGGSKAQPAKPAIKQTIAKVAAKVSAKPAPVKPASHPLAKPVMKTMHMIAPTTKKGMK